MDVGQLIPLDEYFGHQLVAPRSSTQHEDPRWAERTYYLLHVDESLTINAGRQLYRHAGHWKTFAAATAAERQLCLRRQVDFAPADDPDATAVGPLSVEVLRPLREIRLVLEEPGLPLAYDLTFTARFAPVAHEPTLVQRDGVVLTNTMSFFQSGVFDGTVTIDGVERRVQQRAGFRDRSWGMRKHDGAPRRGLVAFVAAEFDDEALYVLLHETASGRRAYTGGWSMTADGMVDTVITAEHDLSFAATWLDGGRLELQMRSGASRSIDFKTQTRLFLSGVGYSPDPDRRMPGTDTFDLGDPSVTDALEGQTDHGSRFRLDDGREGHGYVEIGRGVHPRYRPEG